MASPYHYQSSGGSGVGLVGKSFDASGQIWYVHSGTGSDDVSPQGLQRRYPLATIGQAVTNASAGDLIWILSGHTQSLASAVTFSKAGLKVYGEGTGSTRPQFTCTAAIAMFDVTAAGCWFTNLQFKGSTTAGPTARIRVAATYSRVASCSFEYGSQDVISPTIQYVTGAGQARIEDTSFTCGTYYGDSAVLVTNAMSDLELDNVTFDAGANVNWGTRAFLGSAAVTRLHGINLSFLNDADYSFVTGTTGQWHVANATGSVQGTWTA